MTTDRSLRLYLRAGSTLPGNLCWRIEEGYLRVVCWSDQPDPITLSIWGPGELVIPRLIGVESIELLTLSAVEVEEAAPSREQEQRFVEQQLQQTTNLLLLSRVRPAENRLLQLLHWLGERFGRVSSRGVSLSFEDMNLTHRQLADISGITRVTVTKALSRFRENGDLFREGEDETLRSPRSLDRPEQLGIDQSSLSGKLKNLPPPTPHPLRD